MSNFNLGIIFGGESSEYSVSLHSASSAIRSVNKEKYNLVLIGINQEGKWFYYDGNIDDLEHDHWEKQAKPAILSTNKDQNLIVFEENSFKTIKLDCVLPIVHGTNGEDGTLQGLLELANIPYVGCNHLSSAMSMDKAITHIICEANGIVMAPYLTFIQNHGYALNKAFDAVCDNLTFPVFVKPANAGSSYGITKLDTADLQNFEKAMEYAFKYDQKVIVETGIDGFEVGCAVMGNDYNNLTMGAIDEIDTNKAFFDFDAKYELAETQIYCPARISDEKAREVKQIAGKVYAAMNCSGLARVDMFIDKKGAIYFNELNTIPGFTATSRYPTMMKEIGIDFTELIDRLIDLALSKRG